MIHEFSMRTDVQHRRESRKLCVAESSPSATQRRWAAWAQSACLLRALGATGSMRLSEKTGGRVLVLFTALTAVAVFLTGSERDARKKQSAGRDLDAQLATLDKKR